MNHTIGLAVGLGLYALVVLQNAWLCDDAFITYRTADNLINGYGLTWNAGERVQTFTNPLWLFAISAAYALSGEIYYTAIFVGWLASVLAVFLVLSRVAPDGRSALLGGLFFVASKAFIDYSTSGLENPLTHLILALFIWSYLRRPQALLPLALLAGLATFNRMDSLLLYLPALLSVWWSQRSTRTLGTLALGFAPFVLWECFAIIYYGFPFPNTAYAKLGAGPSSGERILLGIYYALNSLQFDPLTLGAVAASLALVLWKRKVHLLPLALGAMLYILYTVRIGGDFMSGRFFTAPYLVAVALLLHIDLLPRGRSWLVAPGLVLALALLSPHPPLLNGPAYGQGYQSDPSYAGHGVDERAFYHPYTGLLNAIAQPDTLFPIHGWADWGRRLHTFADQGLPAVVTWPFVGFIGFYAGPESHLLDVLGLGDPLTARLPMLAEADWRIGHYKRVLPEGYLETYLYDSNLIADPDLARYYDQLKIIISGNLFTTERWKAIWKMNTGQYDHLIDTARYRQPPPLQIAQSEKLSMGLPITFKRGGFERLRGLGDLYFERRQFHQAVQTYRQVLTLDIRKIQREYPDEHLEMLAAVYLRLASTLVELNQPQAASGVLQAFTTIDPKNAEIRAALQNLQIP